MENTYTDFNFDLDRMKEAVESKTVSIPVAALESFEAFDTWINSEENEYRNIRNKLPNPFVVDYMYDPPLDLYTEVEMLKFAESIIKESLNMLYELSDSCGFCGDFESGRSRGVDQAIILLEKHFGINE